VEARYQTKKELYGRIAPEDFGKVEKNHINHCGICGFDHFELLYEGRTEKFVRCILCGSFWVSDISPKRKLTLRRGV
jgi:hypothetical protein